MEYLLFVVILAAMAFAVSVFLNADPRDVFDIRRHEWFRELTRDYHTSQEQFRSDWALLRVFANRNQPWLYACGFGTLGLLLTGAVLIHNVPESARRLQTAPSEPVLPGPDADSAALDTRSEPELDPDSGPSWAPNTLPDTPIRPDWSVLVSIPPGRVPVETRPLDLTPPTRPIVDPSVAFSEFAPLAPAAPSEQPEPSLTRALPDATDLTVEISRTEPAIDPAEEFTVESVPDADTASALARLRPDSWIPREPAGHESPQPVLYAQRYSALQIRRAAPFSAEDDPVRIRPLATRGNTSPGLHIRSSLSEHVVANRETVYEIELSNPHTESVSGLILEETLPPGWDLIDSTPQCELREQTLRWDVPILGPAESVRFRIRVMTAGDGTAETRTAVTTGAAVESLIDIGGGLLEPELEAPLPETPIDPGGWQTSEPAAERPRPPAPEVAPVSHTELPQLQVRVTPPIAPALGRTQISFTVENTGRIDVDRARILVWLDEALQHPRGNRITRSVPSLAPGESTTLTLNVTVNAAGRTVSRVELRRDAVVLDRETAEFEVRPSSAEAASGWQRRSGK